VFDATYGGFKLRQGSRMLALHHKMSCVQERQKVKNSTGSKMK
jgi:hypothetical protein